MGFKQRFELRQVVWLSGTSVLVLMFVAGFVSSQPIFQAGTMPCMDTAFDKQSRLSMVKDQLVARGITDQKVLTAMTRVPRHCFISQKLRFKAYFDCPLPIGYEQTISQPYVVAYMSQALALKESDRVLEIGTGSGYQAAVLSKIAREVDTIEIVEPLARQAANTLHRLGYRNAIVCHGDGNNGWPDKAPFDAILVTAASSRIPQKLLDQLKSGGRLVMPEGDQNYQELIRVTKTASGLEKEKLLPVRFVPLTSKALKR